MIPLSETHPTAFKALNPSRDNTVPLLHLTYILQTCTIDITEHNKEIMEAAERIEEAEASFETWKEQGRQEAFNKVKTIFKQHPFWNQQTATIYNEIGLNK